MGIPAIMGPPKFIRNKHEITGIQPSKNGKMMENGKMILKKKWSH
jgi:hypothetical protein